MKLLTLFTLVNTFLHLFSQDINEQQQQQINREAIEAILNLVSPACRSEMEIAIESQTDVSQDCRIEIQKAVQTISGYQQQYNQEYSNDQQDETTDETTQSDENTKVVNKPFIHPGFWIGAFVLVLIGGATAYIVHVNKLLKDAFPEKPQKKLSKKKVYLFIYLFF